ncbi:MAG: ABC transporter ATP-binding protein [Candidatus Bipolaricaulis anaerobius]|jgi:ABC-type multidrug transport system fused ATPase/permease subunit|uniref:Putative Xenobiotic-transporting ATPase n=1 Tax=Candidatus Bipolaricaulis anaerobius TaxID=2026885 RepID=A0A2X3K4T5_9BACT|nr:ABC transporter ATP-binding protein [Candidatus Bipolaricaulis anaerobius]MBP7726299.1 ABC transporter ATP-binding protein [Candidatus Bipolaricaulis sp.]MDD3748558.1 ABC transporter ATP-binding protein [Candidatus Bipolaricaulis anaerobius]MDD5764284.1 ABC transporter ATP-binding protein [Candidatus Bipolaricaulis anaerobius]SQD92267.1 putative Xenobiotic-transporting ATPase [Candidatus Bipolaricaulis anaerobius]HOD73136.1 ABC transporter ATP-binding protein [Candidatus Bipolaricaulis anae
MRERLRRVLEFWREHVFRYRALWGLAFTLHLLFFALSGILPFFFKRVIDAVTVLDPRLFALWIAVFLGTEIAQVVLLYTRGYATRRLELKVEQDVQLAMYRRFHTAPYEQALKTKAGEALQRLTSDVPRASPLIVKNVAELVGHIVLVVIVLSLMFAMAPLLAAIAVAFVAVYTVGFRLYGKRAPALAIRRQEAEARYVATAEEGLGALYSVRVQAGLRGVMDRFSRALGAYLREGFALYKLTLLFQGGFTTLITVGSEVAVILTGAWLIFRGEATVGTLVAFSQYINWLYVFVGFMSGFAAEIEPALVSLGRVQEVLSWPEQWTVEEPQVPTTVPDHPYAVEVRDLDFSVGGMSVFRGLSLRVERGRMTAVVGRSGLGKSTLLNLILGLYPVPPEKVFLFGRDVTEIPLPERVGMVAVVEQEPKFVSAGGSLADVLGAPEERIREVARKLGLDDFVQDLFARDLASAKLSELSGGERKRLGVLRGFLREAPLLLLDEPTAFLDERTAATVLDHIRTNFPGVTVVAFSHDPLVCDRCDTVIDLERGAPPG